MGKQTKKLRDLIGVIKDKASLSKATFLSKPKSIPILLAATSHSPPSAPSPLQLSSFLSVGDSSRAAASSLVVSLMDRLHRTHNSVVALKCLLLIHHVLTSGPFILRDQLSVFPPSGGRNYLNLSDFRDRSSTSSWSLSSWVRWYARYLETLLSVSRVLGFFLPSRADDGDDTRRLDRVSSLLNSDLINGVDSLIELIEEMCKIPDSLHLQGNSLTHEVTSLLGSDYASVIDETYLRLAESRERLGWLSFGESVELVCALGRLGDCKERLSVIFGSKEDSSSKGLWDLIVELKGSIGERKEEYSLLTMTGGDRGSESARFGDRVPKARGSPGFRFSSGRFRPDQLSVVIVRPDHFS